MKMINMNTIKEKLNFVKNINMKGFDPKNFKFNKRTFIIVGLVIVALIIVVKMTFNIQKVLFKKKADIAAKARPITFEEEATAVKAYKVKRMDFKDTLPALGNVKGFKEVELKFQVPGVIESINFEEGEKIQEGDIIASLIQKEALLKLKYAEVELNKNKKLLDIGAISPIKMEQSKLEYESAKNDLDKTNIYAVSNGLMGPRSMDVGSYFSPNESGDKVGIFVNIDKVYGEFNIIEKDIPKIALGQKIEVFADAYPGKSFSGTVDRISPVIEGRSRTQTIKVELDNKEGILKPGMFVRALISTYEKKDALVVPSSSLKKKENEYILYVIHKEELKKALMPEKGREKSKDKGILNIFGGKKKEESRPELKPKEKAAEYGTVEPRKVKLGYMSEDLVEVDSGIVEDELVIVEVQEEFKDKARVEISEVQEGIL